MLSNMESDFLKGGFRQGNVPMLRKRLLQMVTGVAPVTERVRKTLARYSRANTLFKWLSVDAITESRHALARLLGVPVLLVALLLDAREDVRNKAEEWLKEQVPFLSMEAEGAVERLLNQFEDIVTLVGGVEHKGATLQTPEAWQTQKEGLERRLRDARTEARRLKGVDDKLATAHRRLKEQDERMKTLEQAQRELEAFLRQKRRESDEFKAELKRAADSRDLRLSAALDLALAKEFHGWLKLAQKVESAADDGTRQKDLLVRADAALQHQSEIDRHSGNRACLLERRAQLSDKLQEVRSALHNALRRAPRLQQVEGELVGELQALDSVLESERKPTPLMAQLDAHIQVAGDETLPQLRELIELLGSCKLLNERELADALAVMHKRMELIKALAINLPPVTSALPHHPGERAMVKALAGQTPAVLLVDGHNALFGLPSRYNPQRATALTEADKRSRLTSDIVRLVADSHTLRVRIVFDGPVPCEEVAAANVTVIYSGGEGEHRADGVLVNLARFYQQEDADVPVILASNDRELCAQAQRVGAIELPILKLGAFFSV